MELAHPGSEILSIGQREPAAGRALAALRNDIVAPPVDANVLHL